MKRKPNPELLDDEMSKFTVEWFARAKPATQRLTRLIGKAATAEMVRSR